MNILDAASDPQLFGGIFRDRATWAPWFTVLRALFGLGLEAGDLERFRQCTGRSTPNPDGYTEAWFCVGRRAGKSFVLAVVAVWLACFKDWKPYLSPGERGTIMVIATDRRQAQVILGYIRGLLATPMLKDLVLSETQETINLRGNITVEIHTASYRSLRGRTVVAALLDECAFWRSDETSANPDAEILNALRPSMATVPRSMLLCASSPYARRGILWNAYQRHYGKDDALPLVWHAPTLAMNCTVPQSVIDAALADDEPAARAEYFAEFRSDLEAFVKLDVVQDCLGDYVERAPDSSLTYSAFVDPSGGSSDAFTLSIGHREKDAVHIDLVLERKPPFSPSQVIAEFAEVLNRYRVRYVTGDRYAGEFPREMFRRHSIEYRLAPKNRTELYQALLPLLNSGRITLPRNDVLVKQLVGLERRVSRNGRELIDHGQRGHDDVANAVAGCAELCRANTAATPVFGVWGMSAPVKRPSKFDGAILEGDLKGGFASSA
jgi:hypothetical protein